MFIAVSMTSQVFVKEVDDDMFYWDSDIRDWIQTFVLEGTPTLLCDDLDIIEEIFPGKELTMVPENGGDDD